MPEYILRPKYEKKRVRDSEFEIIERGHVPQWMIIGEDCSHCQFSFENEKESAVVLRIEIGVLFLHCSCAEQCIKVVTENEARVQPKDESQAKYESKYVIAKQFTDGYLAALTPAAIDEKQGGHWMAGFEAGYRKRLEKTLAMNEYLVSIGVDPMAMVSIQ